ncbi:hypothetical protein [Gorillibacterium timonense]|uniref:hypothetical protein n=1 Tax=Gorillibacterium timonense TaxID=1689269 RepID=UPI00071D2C02|nr:hypothetical protein [Gorillibacterium timonense]
MKPLTIEEISLKTGLPTMYIEDALPHLLYGDAMEQTGSKYGTNFIVLRLGDKERLEKEFAPIVEESQDERDRSSEYASGCNVTDAEKGLIYYYHTVKYFTDLYDNEGTRRLAADAHKLPPKCTNGWIPDGLLSEDDVIRLLQTNLIIKSGDTYKLNFACFLQEQFTEFSGLFRLEDETITKLITDLILSIHKSFKSFVPKRLDSQINQWVSCFVHNVAGYVTEELIHRNVLEKPSLDQSSTNGVFYIEGAYLPI